METLDEGAAGACLVVVLGLEVEADVDVGAGIVHLVMKSLPRGLVQSMQGPSSPLLLSQTELSFRPVHVSRSNLAINLLPNLLDSQPESSSNHRAAYPPYPSHFGTR